MDFDEILPDLGEYGTYQKLVLWFLLLPGTMPCGFHAYNQLFMASTPPHWCQPPQELRNAGVEVGVSLSEEQIKNLSVPYDNHTRHYSHCQRYDYNFTSHLASLLSSGEWGAHVEVAPPVDAVLVQCDQGWHYDQEDYETSVVSDWDLVCERDFLPTLALVLLGASGLVGNYIFGYIQDGAGRHPAFFIYLVIECAFGIATSFTTSFTWWLVCRVGVGFTVPAIMSTPMVLAIELVGPSKRTYTTVVMNVAFSCTLIILAGVTWLVRDWSQLSLATTIPFLVFFLFWWVLPESPRWLLAKGRLDEAEVIMAKMARVNRKTLPSNYMANLRRKFEVEKYMSGREDNSPKKSYGILDLFRTPNLCRKTLIITFIWFTNTSVYVGLSYYAPVLGGDPYLNFFLAGVAELPTYLFLWPAMEYWGRRWTLCFSMIIGGCACVATVITQEDPVVTLVLYCIGKFGISSSFVVLPLMASELYPTVVRGMGLSVSAVAGMIGPIVIPLINHLGSEMMVLPLIIMGILLNLGGIFSLLLPETLHQHLPQTLEEGEEFGKHWTLAEYCTCCPRRHAKVMKEKEATLPQGNSSGGQGEGTFTDFHKPLPGSTIANNKQYDEDQKVEDGELKALMGATNCVHSGGGSGGGEGNCVEAGGGGGGGKVSRVEAIAEENLEEEESDQENKEQAQRLISPTIRKMTIV